jgi:hypothetical protein
MAKIKIGVELECSFEDAPEHAVGGYHSSLPIGGGVYAETDGSISGDSGVEYTFMASSHEQIISKIVTIKENVPHFPRWGKEWNCGTHIHFSYAKANTKILVSPAALHWLQRETFKRVAVAFGAEFADKFNDEYNRTYNKPLSAVEWRFVQNLQFGRTSRYKHFNFTNSDIPTIEWRAFSVGCCKSWDEVIRLLCLAYTTIEDMFKRLERQHFRRTFSFVMPTFPATPNITRGDNCVYFDGQNLNRLWRPAFIEDNTVICDMIIRE